MRTIAWGLGALDKTRLSKIQPPRLLAQPHLLLRIKRPKLNQPPCKKSFHVPIMLKTHRRSCLRCTSTVT